jgi:hypothetical protein
MSSLFGEQLRSVHADHHHHLLHHFRTGTFSIVGGAVARASALATLSRLAAGGYRQFGQGETP